MAKLRTNDRLIAFFSTLLADLDDLHGDDVLNFAIARQRTRARKRAKLGTSDLSSKAISTFVATNETVAKTSINLDQYVLNNARLFIAKALERVTNLYDPDDVQGTLYLPYLFDNWRFGPGASFEVKGTHCAQKIAEDMTCTKAAEPLVSRLRMLHPYLNLKDKVNGGGIRIVSGSKLTTVPKNEDTDRTIATEPSGSMALQLAAGLYIEEALRLIGLDISTQEPKNKAAAARAYRDGLATIDLKAASDMIQPELVRLLFPPVWYDLLMRLRSPSTRLPNGEQLNLNMISTMGNGFTFPLMTFILVSLIYGYRCMNPRNPTLRIDWSVTCVYGDDIIVPQNEFQDCVETLQSAGFVVNLDKSYSGGSFFESCGGDYYKGVEVTPFYVRDLSKYSEIYVVINQVIEWCSRFEVVLPRTLRYLRGLIPTEPFLVPEWKNPDQGILTTKVSRRYKVLAIKSLRVKLKDHFFLTSLASGGYIESCGGLDVFFAPRVDNPRYKVKTERLPQGFLNGWDPRKRSQRVSSWALLMVELFF